MQKWVRFLKVYLPRFSLKNAHEELTGHCAHLGLVRLHSSWPWRFSSKYARTRVELLGNVCSAPTRWQSCCSAIPSLCTCSFAGGISATPLHQKEVGIGRPGRLLLAVERLQLCEQVREPEARFLHDRRFAASIAGVTRNGRKHADSRLNKLPVGCVSMIRDGVARLTFRLGERPILSYGPARSHSRCVSYPVVA
jgi:hypothetical protein